MTNCVTRKKWYCALIEELLKEPKNNQLFIWLYENEIDQIRNDYPVKVVVGEQTLTSQGRVSCIIEKENF